MSVLASLIAALERANGDRLVLCSGETPHVLAGGTRHDLGTTKASVKALEALTHQILSPEARQEFAATHSALEPLSDAVSPIPLVVGTYRSGDTIRIELRRLRPATPASAPAVPSGVTSLPPDEESSQRPPAVPLASGAPTAEPLDHAATPADCGEDREWQPIEERATQPAAASASPVSDAQEEQQHELPVAPLPLASEPVTLAAAESDPVASVPVESDSVASVPVVSEPMTSAAAESDPVALVPVESDTVAPAPVASEPITSAAAESDPVALVPVESDTVAPAPVASEPVTSVPAEILLDAPVPMAGDPVASVPESLTPAPAEEDAATSIAAEDDWVASVSAERDSNAASSIPAETHVDADGFATTSVADIAPDADRASFDTRPMKVVSIATALRNGTAKIAAESTSPCEAETLEYWVREAARCDATALYLRAGQAPLLRVRERLQPLGDQQVDRSAIDAVTAALAAGDSDWSQVSDSAWTRELAGIGRVTCQTFTDDCGAGLVVHLSSRRAASALCKDIPRQVRRACEHDDGIVIVAAPALPDVMQMVAALGEWTAQRRAGYLVSIEPPSGLGHDISGILVSSRRIAGTERDVADAIRRAMHEAPDVLVIAMASGSIAEEAIRAAQSGCLVIVGATAPTASQAVETLVSSVRSDEKQLLRQSLAASFRCGFSYRALPGRDGSRVVVQDLLLGTSDVRARLEREDFGGLESLQRARTGGMRSLDAALAGAVHRGDMTLRRAVGMAGDRQELVRLVRQAAHERNRAARKQSSEPSSDPTRVLAGVTG
jgi:twitching motility protein PilU